MTRVQDGEKEREAEREGVDRVLQGQEDSKNSS